MSNSGVTEMEKNAGSQENEMERGTQPRTTEEAAAGGSVGSVLRRWKAEDWMRKLSMGLRAVAFVFSLISFLVMASNNHGPGKNFGEYEEYRYLLAMAIISTIYTGLQCFRYVHQLSSGKEFVNLRISASIDFYGDQTMAYMLLSSASSAVPMTNRMREGADNIFTDSAAAAISMSLLAFISLAVSAIIAGYKLSTQSFVFNATSSV